MVKTVVKQLKDKAIEIKKKKSFFKDLHDNREYLLMIVPGVLQLILFNYLPLFGLILAFKTVDYSKGFFNMDWNGFKTSSFCLKTQMFYSSSQHPGIQPYFYCYGRYSTRCRCGGPEPSEKQNRCKGVSKLYVSSVLFIMDYRKLSCVRYF